MSLHAGQHADHGGCDVAPLNEIREIGVDYGRLKPTFVPIQLYDEIPKVGMMIKTAITANNLLYILSNAFNS